MVKQAEDGQKLLNILHSMLEIPQIVFLDINMPGKNGFQCLEEIRDAKGGLKRVPVIMLSTSSSHGNIQRSFELGADFYAVKPSTFAGLKDLLYEVLAEDWKGAEQGRNKLYSSLTWML